MGLIKNYGAYSFSVIFGLLKVYLQWNITTSETFFVFVCLKWPMLRFSHWKNEKFAESTERSSKCETKMKWNKEEK